MAKVKLPTMLNYTRSIVPSNGVFTCQIKGWRRLPGAGDNADSARHDFQLFRH